MNLKIEIRFSSRISNRNRHKVLFHFSHYFRSGQNYHIFVRIEILIASFEFDYTNFLQNFQTRVLAFKWLFSRGTTTKLVD